MLQDGGVDLIEQPCAIHNIDAMQRLSRSLISRSWQMNH